MFRLRFAILLLVAGFLICGCCLSEHPLFSRLRGSSAGECCDAEAVPDSTVPIGDSGAPVILPSPAVMPPPGTPVSPPQDRLQPVPISPRTPAFPSGRSRDTSQVQPVGDKQN